MPLLVRFALRHAGKNVTTIDFYFNARRSIQVACRLAGKALAQKKRMLIYAPEPEAASRIDKLLWTWPAIGFVPHCAPTTRSRPRRRCSSAADAGRVGDCGLLLNLGARCPPHFERFERLLEVVVDRRAEREAARDRFRFYQARGYAISNHDLAAGNEWRGRPHRCPVLTEIVEEGRLAAARGDASGSAPRDRRECLRPRRRSSSARSLERLGPTIDRVTGARGRTGPRRAHDQRIADGA